MISSQVFSFYQHEPGFILKSLNTIKIHLKYRVPFLKKRCVDGWGGVLPDEGSKLNMCGQKKGHRISHN